MLFLDGAYSECGYGDGETCVRGDFVMRSAFYGHYGVTSKGGANYVRLAVSPAAERAFFSEHGWCARLGRVAIDEQILAELLHAPFGGDHVLAESRQRPLRETSTRGGLSDAAFRIAYTDVVLEDLAEALGLSPWGLTRAFQRDFRISPSGFRLQARLQRGMRLMAETAAPLAVIAAEAGFTDQSHFSHALKRSTGLTPAVMRRRLALA